MAIDPQRIIKILDDVSFIDEYEFSDISAEELEGCLSSKYFTPNEEQLEALQGAIKFLKDNEITIHHVEQFGGEGDGDSYWSVWQCDDVHYRNDTWYASYAGIGDWEGARVVEAKEKVIIEYS